LYFKGQWSIRPNTQKQPQYPNHHQGTNANARGKEHNRARTDIILLVMARKAGSVDRHTLFGT
jgi:hypothetical protein